MPNFIRNVNNLFILLLKQSLTTSKNKGVHNSSNLPTEKQATRAAN